MVLCVWRPKSGEPGTASALLDADADADAPRSCTNALLFALPVEVANEFACALGNAYAPA